MAGIFISYRRADSDGWAGRLRDTLRARFGNRVFQDVENIADGEIFSEVIGRALQECDVALIIIGPNWASAQNAEGRRLDQADDWVRTETSLVLNRGIRVIPVLVGGASMPRAEDLPEELRSLTKRQAREIRSSSWDSDVALLTTHLKQIVDRRRKRPVWQYAAAALVLAIGVFAGSQYFWKPEPLPAPAELATAPPPLAATPKQEKTTTPAAVPPAAVPKPEKAAAPAPVPPAAAPVAAPTPSPAPRDVAVAKPPVIPQPAKAAPPPEPRAAAPSRVPAQPASPPAAPAKPTLAQPPAPAPEPPRIARVEPAPVKAVPDPSPAAPRKPAAAPPVTEAPAAPVAGVGSLNLANRPPSARELKVGDTWTYRLREVSYGRNLGTVTHEISGGDKGGIRETLRLGARGDTQRRLPLEPRIFEQPLDQGAMLFEFAPFMTAFSELKPGMTWRKIAGVTSSDSINSWQVSGKVTGRERVRVPAGNFDAIKAELEGELDLSAPSTRDPYSETIVAYQTYSIWFAPEVSRAVKYERRTYNRARRLLEHEQYELVSYKLQ